MKNFASSKVNIIVILAGLACGPSTLSGAHLASPPFDWASVFLVFFGTLIGLPFVIGIQLFKNNPSPAIVMVSSFKLISLFMAASGLSAFLYGLYVEGFTPQSVFFLALGTALIISVGICSVLADIKVKQHEYAESTNGNPNQPLKRDEQTAGVSE